METGADNLQIDKSERYLDRIDMKLLYYLTYAVLWLCSLLPMWVHYLISDGIYVVVYHLVGYRKKMVSARFHLLRTISFRNSWALSMS